MLLAHPAGHSLSPVMHDAAFAAAGIDARYEAWDVPPERLASSLERLRGDGFLGANVTVPHKRAVLDHVDEVTDEARAIGAVNTLRSDGGRLRGDNTDAIGFASALREAGLDPAGRTIVLLGAGGAARAVAHALLRGGARSIRIRNRTRATAEALTRATGDDARVRVFAADDPEAHRGAEWWINATSVGMAREGDVRDESPVAREAFAASADATAAIDLVYRPRRTRFLREAREAGLRTVDGVGMLVHQGAASFRAWTGRAAPVDVMREAVGAALAAEERA